MKTTAFCRGISLLAAFCMVISLALGCTGCGGAGGSSGASAATMFLRKTEGTVGVADAEGAEVAPAENLGLYSGYTVGAGAASYAWIDLDKVKLAKLDENSAAAIIKDGKNLSIDVTSGSLFFNVTEPLADDETMEIRASSMIVGIRGTCGWVEVPEDGTMYLYLLEGKVECAAGESTAAVYAGEMAELTEDGGITVFAFTAQDVPGFVADEIREDEALQQALDELPEEMTDGAPDGMQTEGSDGLTLNTGGFELDADEAAMYEAFLRYLSDGRQDGHQTVYAELVDFEADGSPELLTVLQFPIDSPGSSGLAFEVYRMESGTFRNLAFELAPGTIGLQYASCSLVQRGGRPFVQTLSKSFEPDELYKDAYYFTYYGLFAGHDGGPEDWVMADHFVVLGPGDDGDRVMLVSAHNTNGFVDNDTLNDNEQINDIGEQEALLGQYTLVRELYTRPFEG